MKTPLVLALTVSTVVLAGIPACKERAGQGDVLTPSPSGLSSETAPTDDVGGGRRSTGVILASSRSAVTFTGEGNPFIQELIHRGAFDGAKIDIAGPGYFRPNRWYIAEAARDHAVTIIFPGQEERGQLLQLIPIENEELTVNQAISDPGGAAAGATIVVTAEARTKFPGHLAIVLTYNSNGTPARAAVIHPGGDEWKALRLQHTFPAQAPPTDLLLSIARRSVSGLMSQVDNVSARLLRPRDVTATDGAEDIEMLRDTTFDESGWFGSTLDWRAANWGGATYDAIKWVIDEEAPERLYVVAFPSPPVGGVSLVQTVGGLTASIRGKTLVLSAWGKSSAESELGITVRYTVQGEDRIVNSDHSGSGQWEQMIARVPIPENSNPHTLRIELWRRHMGELPAYVDSPSLTLAD